MFKKIKGKIISLFSGNGSSLNQNENSEQVYYTNLFTKKDSGWSTYEPNADEVARMNAIIPFLYYANGWYAHEKRTDLKILDLGCGRGWLSNILSDFGRVTGIDPVENVINYAKKLYGGKNIDFLSGTIENLIDRNYLYDVVVSSEVIEHIPDNQKKGFAANIKKVLVDKGFVIITTPRKEIYEAIKGKLDQPVEDWMSEEEMRNLFVESGFRVIGNKNVLPLDKKDLNLCMYQIWAFQKNN